MVDILVVLGKIILHISLAIIGLLLSVMYLSYFERKLVSSMQYRKGAERTGFLGILQPLADMLKLMRKEPSIPRQANIFLFTATPFLMLAVTFAAWAIIPIQRAAIYSDFPMGMLFLFTVLLCAAYGPFLVGWVSRSPYTILSAARSLSLFISYQIILGLVFLAIALWSGSFNLVHIIKEQEHYWFICPLFPFFLVFIITSLMTTHQTPFDISTAPPDLIAGYRTEYSSILAGFLLLNEKLQLLLYSTLVTILFLGGWNTPFKESIPIPGIIWFLLKTWMVLFVLIWVRSSLPRLRYDQIICLCWQYILPFLFASIMILAIIKIALNI